MMEIFIIRYRVQVFAENSILHKIHQLGSSGTSPKNINPELFSFLGSNPLISSGLFKVTEQILLLVLKN